MATKKDYSEIKTNRIYDTVAEATAEPTKRPRKEYTDEEKEMFIRQMKSSGRKGVKMPRINMAFAPDIYDYIKTMSRVRGESLTEFVNLVLKKYMDQNMEIYEKALEFRNSL